MRRPYVIAVIIGVLLLVLVEWLFLHRRELLGPPDAGATADASVPLPATGALRTSEGVAMPTAVITPQPKPARPCVRGRVVNAATNAGVPGAQVALATQKGVVQALADGAGAFELQLDEARSVALAEVSAAGFFPYRPAWGHFGVELSLSAESCVSDLVLTLVPRLEYRGWVLRPDGEPVAGARVTVATADEPPGAPLVSAADGAFTFAAAEGATVVARHPDFAPGVATVDFRAAVTHALFVTLGPKPADGGVARATLSGLVLDARDAGVAGAEVRALQALDEGDALHLEGATESGSDGRFSLEVEGPGPWTVAAHVDGALAAPVQTGGEPVVLRLLAGATLQGTVRDGDGRPVQSFAVLLGVKDGPLRIARTEVRSVVDAQGRFTLRGLPTGAVSVSVSALNFASSEPAELSLTLEQPARLDVTLRAGGRVYGQVIERKSRAPLGSARVSLESREDATLAASPVAHTDLDGGFSLVGLGPGRRSLFVTAERHHARLVSVEVNEGQATGPLVVDLAPLKPGEDPRLELVGIGAVLEAKGDVLLIKELFPGGGAAEAGLVVGDGVLAIDGEPTVKLGFAGGVERIRGAEGTFVDLQVRRGDGSVTRVAVPRRRLEN